MLNIYFNRTGTFGRPSFVRPDYVQLEGGSEIFRVDNNRHRTAMEGNNTSTVRR